MPDIKQIKKEILTLAGGATPPENYAISGDTRYLISDIWGHTPILSDYHYSFISRPWLE